MNDEGIDQAAPARDKGDTELDAVLTATNSRILAAIRHDLDLDVGLAQIIGTPPWLEMHTPEVPTEDGQSSEDPWRRY